VRKYGYPGDDGTRIRLFERWERFWALATLEFRDGALERGDEDAMRGVRDATRAWRGGDAPLPLDFSLISRQSELDGLGAYLSSLREYGLVFPGSLRVTPAAREMLDSFWSEPSERNWSHLYEEYALEALDFESPTIARSSGRRLTLAGLGKRSRLSSLVRRGRTVQQGRLWNALFGAARDGSTHPLAERLVVAHGDGVDAPEALLEGLLAGHWEELTSDLVNKVEVALAFGRLARALLRQFDRAYGYVDEHGWVADFDAVAQASFPDKEATRLRGLCEALLSARDAYRFRELQFHGPDFLKLVEKLTTSGAIDSECSLRDFVPELVYAPVSALDLREREFPELRRNYALAIEKASHDPRERSLIVTWSSGAADLPAWRLTYDEERLAHSRTTPTKPLVIADFVLKSSTAEVVLHVDGRRYPVPILVTDLVALPAAPAVPTLGLDELLMLLGRRIGAERAVRIKERGGNGDDDSNDLSSFFGDGFGPTDVFRAWWSVAEDLKDPDLSVPAFRLRIEGALGVGAAWSCMREAIDQGSLPAEEAWFYGAELLRTLAEIELPTAEDRDTKARLLSDFCKRVRSDLGRCGLDPGTRSWAKRILAFYGEAKA